MASEVRARLVAEVADLERQREGVQARHEAAREALAALADQDSDLSERIVKAEMTLAFLDTLDQVAKADWAVWVGDLPHDADGAVAAAAPVPWSATKTVDMRVSLKCTHSLDGDGAPDEDSIDPDHVKEARRVSTCSAVLTAEEEEAVAKALFDAEPSDLVAECVPGSMQYSDLGDRHGLCRVTVKCHILVANP
jgi:hypothetical protein